MILRCLAVLVYAVWLVNGAGEEQKEANAEPEVQEDEYAKLKQELARYEVYDKNNYPYRFYKNLNDGSKEKVRDIGGAQGLVLFRRIRNEVRTRVAIKYVKNRMGLRHILQEIAALKYITDNQFPHSVQLLGVYRGPDVQNTPEAYVVMNFLGFTSLHDAIKDDEHFMDEKTICRSFGRLLTVLWYMRQHNMIHRDIKPKNILLDAKDDLFVTDFGIAIFTKPGETNTKFGGTSQTMAPEMLLNGMRIPTPYDHRVDLWSAFVVLHMWLNGQTRGPFDHRCNDGCEVNHHLPKYRRLYYEAIYNKMKRMENKPLAFGSKVPKLAADLIRRVLVIDPNKRPSLEEIMEHDWFKEHKVPFYCRLTNPRDSLLAYQRRGPAMHHRKPRSAGSSGGNGSSSASGGELQRRRSRVRSDSNLRRRSFRDERRRTGRGESNQIEKAVATVLRIDNNAEVKAPEEILKDEFVLNEKTVIDVKPGRHRAEEHAAIQPAVKKVKDPEEEIPVDAMALLERQNLEPKDKPIVNEPKGDMTKAKIPRRGRDDARRKSTHEGRDDGYVKQKRRHRRVVPVQEESDKRPNEKVRRRHQKIESSEEIKTTSGELPVRRRLSDGRGRRREQPAIQNIHRRAISADDGGVMQPVVPQGLVRKRTGDWSDIEKPPSARGVRYKPIPQPAPQPAGKPARRQSTLIMAPMEDQAPHVFGVKRTVEVRREDVHFEPDHREAQRRHHNRKGSGPGTPLGLEPRRAGSNQNTPVMRQQTHYHQQPQSPLKPIEFLPLLGSPMIPVEQPLSPIPPVELIGPAGSNPEKPVKIATRRKPEESPRKPPSHRGAAGINRRAISVSPGHQNRRPSNNRNHTVANNRSSSGAGGPTPSPTRAAGRASRRLSDSTTGKRPISQWRKS